MGPMPWVSNIVPVLDIRKRSDGKPSLSPPKVSPYEHKFWLVTFFWKLAKNPRIESAQAAAEATAVLIPGEEGRCGVLPQANYYLIFIS